MGCERLHFAIESAALLCYSVVEVRVVPSFINLNVLKESDSTVSLSIPTESANLNP
ncbi:hypothetical protein CCACVL1_01700 [Corchorus capsularis]|uniref:Uncharacterized protein n=1 Tax=Corchorus capsularis TaxID=210143 RepID=A0A1R3KGC2_COCAP|nr:hypothetical protein CCACVL1_01700 [Corchorus capsularis]